MGRFEYDTTIEEWWALFATILERHRLKFAVDRWYDEPTCQYFSHLPESLKEVILGSKRRVYLLGTFSNGPLHMNEQRTGTKVGSYAIDPFRGGPWLDFTMPAVFQEGGLTWFGQGHLMFQKLYWDDSLASANPASKELKDAFGSVKSTLQAFLSLRRIQTTKRWVSPGAWDLFLSGRAAFPIGGKCFTAMGEVPPPKPWRNG